MKPCPFCADAETSDWRCFCNGSREMSQEQIDRLFARLTRKEKT